MTTAAVLLLVAAGCTAEKSTTAEEKAPVSAKADPLPPTPAPPEVDTAVPPEPPPPPPPTLPPGPPGPDAVGGGFEVGAKPEAHVDKDAVEAKPPLRHAGATVSVSPDMALKPTGEPPLRIQVRVEFEGLGAEQGLNHVRAVAGSYCDQLVPEVQEIAKLDDGRWLLDAQLACRGGEDYFSADNAHTLIVVDSKAHTAAVLWVGADTGSNAMGVCVASSVSDFEVSGEEVIVRKTEITELDKAEAKQFPDAAEGCVAKPKTTTEVARISLARGQ
jgi:hypothetical protein